MTLVVRKDVQLTIRSKVITKYLVFVALAGTLISGCTSTPLKPLGSHVTNMQPRVFLAHGASSGAHPMNSLAAINETLSRSDYDGIEVDVVLTGDSIPVLAHDPWLSDETCRRYDGQPFEPVYIQDVFFAELNELFECRFPSLEGAPGEYHPLASLEDALAVLRRHPEKSIYLDLKIQKKMTLDAEEYGAEIFLALMDQEINNPVFIEIPEPDQVEAIKSSFDGYDVTLVLSYPAFYAGENWDIVGAKAAVHTLFSDDEPMSVIEKSDADALMSPTVVMSYEAVKNLHKNSILYGTFLVDDIAAMNVACDHGADIIITDIPPGDRCGTSL